MPKQSEVQIGEHSHVKVNMAKDGTVYSEARVAFNDDGVAGASHADEALELAISIVRKARNKSLVDKTPSKANNKDKKPEPTAVETDDNPRRSDEDQAAEIAKRHMKR